MRFSLGFQIWLERLLVFLSGAFVAILLNWIAAQIPSIWSYPPELTLTRADFQVALLASARGAAYGFVPAYEPPNHLTPSPDRQWHVP